MGKIKVVHLVEDLKIGGLERIISLLVTGIDTNKFHAKVWCITRGGGIYDELISKGIDAEILGMDSRGKPRFLAKLCGKLRKENIEIIHTHGITATNLGRIAAIFARTPVVITHEHSSYCKYSFKQIIIRRFLSLFTDKIICCSQAAADFVIKAEKINSNKISVIYNGVDIEELQRHDIGAKFQKDRSLVGCVASLFPHKGHRYFLEAAKYVIDNYHDKVRFILAGRGVLRKELEEYAKKLGISEEVIFEGERANIYDLLPTFDLVVLPSSEREGLGLSIIEAMALGKSVIGTAIGGIPEVIRDGENGLLVPPKDSLAMGKAIVAILENKEKARAMGQIGRTIVKEKFSSRVMLEKVENLYQDLLSKKMQEKKHNILFTSCFASLKGGGQRSLLLLIKYLNKDKFSPFLIVPCYGELSEEALKLGVKVFVIGFPRVRSFNILSSLFALCKLYGIVKKYKIDIIHTDSPRETFYAGVVKKFTGALVFFHLRVTESFYWLDKICYALADRMIAVSNSAALRFAAIDKQGKVKVVYNSVELDVFIPEKRSCQKDSFRIGYFGRIDRRKGIEVLIKAVKRIQNSALEAVIMGGGDQVYLNELKAMSGGLKVEFKEYRKDVLNELVSVDALVLPSLRGEGLSRIIIESMALGKPIIVSDMPENREALGGAFGEFIFPLGKDDKLAAILENILNNRNILYEKQDLLRTRAEELFDVRVNTGKIEDLYISLLGKS